MIERAEKKLYLDRTVTRDGMTEEITDDDADSGRLMATLRFGCNAVFGGNSKTHSLPTDEDIEAITDRSRTEDFLNGKLKGGTDSSTKDFNARKSSLQPPPLVELTLKRFATNTERSSVPKTWAISPKCGRSVSEMVDGTGSGYGSKSVPVLTSNDYDLVSGEKIVFDRELKGRSQIQMPKKQAKTLESQDFCQVCGDGGHLVCCPRCPVSVHLQCVGLTKAKDFMNCTHHN
jgi:hypothetical protein